jgi:L-iditol 2-dehydrogenase
VIIKKEVLLKMETMLAAVWYGKGIENFKLEKIKRPKPGPGEILLRVKACFFGALSLRSILKGNPKLKPPAVMGRMFSGDVVETGEGVNIPIGTRVAVNPEAPCGKCFYCKKNEPVHCLDLPKLSPGGFAEYVKLSPQFVPGLVELPEHVSYEEGAYIETLACTLYGTLRAGVMFGDVAVLIGCGGIGLTFIPILLNRGVSKIIAVDIDPLALRKAKEIGATYTVNPKDEDVAAFIKEKNEGYGADVVIEAVGNEKTYAQTFELVRSGGTILGFGGCPQNSQFVLDPNTIHYKTLKFIGTWHYTPDLYKRAFQMLAEGRINIKPIITHKLPLSEIHKAVDIYPLSECKTLAILP